MRLIDADKMIGDLSAIASVFKAITLDGMIEGIKRQATIDAVEVVRCRDCIFAEPISEDKIGYRERELSCAWLGCAMLPEDFCSNGERRADDDR